MRVGSPGFIDAWQVPQSGLLGCGAGGGAPWHESHAGVASATWVHTGVVLVPPVSAAPWQ
jgi:hypothetical protein